MSNATSTPTEADTLDADRGALGPTTPNGVEYLRGIVRSLMFWGTQIATRLEQCAGTPAFAAFVRSFGTAALRLILARIARGLLLATTFEARLRRHLENGGEIFPSRPYEQTPHAAAAEAQPAPQRPRRSIPAPDPLGLPTAEPIAQQIRRRPVGSVIADICAEFGMSQEQCGRALWQELEFAVTTFGGNIARWLRQMKKRIRAPCAEEHSDAAAPAPSAPPPQSQRLPPRDRCEYDLDPRQVRRGLARLYLLAHPHPHRFSGAGHRGIDLFD
jgi:hypothetical protein